MEKEFIPYEFALELKELGFDEECFNVYDKLKYLQNQEEMEMLSLEFIKAPLWQQAFDWFREKYNIESKIDFTFEHETPNKYQYFYQIVTDNFICGNGVVYNWTYEQARLECLKKLIEIVKQK